MKNPPSAYIQKLKSYLDTGGVSRKVRASLHPMGPPLSLGARPGANGSPCPRSSSDECRSRHRCSGSWKFP